MFEWLKNKSQNGMYRTMIEAMTSGTRGSPEIVIAINAAAAATCVRVIRQLVAPSFTFDALMTPTGSISHLISANQLFHLESMLMECSLEARPHNKISSWVFGLGAGYFSVQKRHDFASETAVTLVNAIRVGARTCDELGLSPEDSMELIMERATEFSKKTRLPPLRWSD